MWVFVPFNFPFTRWMIYTAFSSDFPTFHLSYRDNLIYANWKPCDEIIDHRRLSAALKTSSYELPPANREIEFVFCGTPQKREVSDVNVYMQRLSWWAIKKLFVYFQSSCDEQLKYLISMSWYRHDDEIMLLDSFKAIEYMCCVYKKRERERREKEKPEKTRIAQQR